MAVVELSSPERQASVVQGLSDIINKKNQHLFVPPETESKWQPADFIPDVAELGVPVWQEKCAELREQAQTISKPLRVVIVGNLITEAALSSYAMALARLRGLEDITGIDDGPFPEQRRSWLGDENRHEEVMSDWAKLSGLYNTREVQQSVHRLILNGFDNGAGLDLYKNIFYVVKQEKFTAIAHHNTGHQVSEQQKAAGISGPSIFGTLINEVAKDEDRHHAAYFNMWDGIMAEDPEGAVIAMRDMMKTGIIMPARFMDVEDGHRSTGLFDRYAKVAAQLGILSPMDNYRVDDKVIKRSRIASRSFHGKAAQAQEDIFAIHQNDQEDAAKAEEFISKVRARGREPETSRFSWLAKEAA